MAYQSLYRRYRSRRFAEVLGQDQVTTALRNAVRTEKVGHAYLFSGPRGTGKTSTARILAKALNCTNLHDGEPCCECEACLSIESGTSYDLQELDAASNNKVENVRDLIERVALGSPGRTKVYILDEVHMLSAGASNALLKTLEEPPPHVVFVLATTDPHKVLPTIRSRTQHFEFHLLSADVLTEHVRFVIGDAGLDVGEDAIAQVIRQGGGSARDTLSALDQVAAAGGVTESTEHAEALVDAICAGDTGLALRSVADAVGAGRDPRLLGEALLARLRDAFLTRMGAPLPQATEAEREQATAWAGQLTDRSTTRALEEVGAALLEMRQAPDPRIPLEVALVRLTRPAETGADLGALLDRIERLERTIAAGVPTAAPTASAGSTPPAATEGAAPTAAATPADPPAAAPVPTPDRAPEPPNAPATTPRDESVSSGGRPGDAARAALAQAAKATPGRPGPASSEAAPPPPPPPPSPARPSRGAAPTDSAPPRSDDPSPVAAGTTGTSEAAAASEQAAAPSTTAAQGGRSAAPDHEAPDSTGTADATEPAMSPSSEEVPGSGAARAGTDDSGDRFAAAWSDSVLPALKGMAGALFRPAELVGFDGSTATLSFDNDATRDNAERKRAEVEEAAAVHFGQPVKLKLTVAGAGGSPAPTRPSSSAEAPVPAAAAQAEEAEIIDVHDLEDAPADTRTGVDRLTEAFPGAELLPEETS